VGAALLGLPVATLWAAFVIGVLIAGDAAGGLGLLGG
jgi:hypothetical protein